MPSTCTSSTSSRPRLNLSGMCGTAGRVMRVGRVPLKRGERGPGPPSLSPALPAIPVLHPGLELLRPLPCRGASRGVMEASQILAQCPGLPLTSLGCPWEDGLKMGSQHQGTRSLCPKRAQRMSSPLRCTRYRQGGGGSLCLRMEAVVALSSQRRVPVPQDGGHCCPAIPSVRHGGLPSAAWLHVCGVCVSVPGQGRCQCWACHSPRREKGGLGNRAHGTLASSPGPPLAQSVVLETGPQPSPSTATFAPTPASLQRTVHPRSCQAGRTCANCGVGRLGLDPQPLQPPSPPRTDEQLRLWPLPHPQFSPSAAACSPLPCFLHIHHWHVCHLLPFCSFAPPFCSAFALCWCGSFSSQLPSCYLLTLRRKVSKLWSRDGKSLLSSPTF